MRLMEQYWGYHTGKGLSPLKPKKAEPFQTRSPVSFRNCIYEK